jgi:hypothetical protein
VYQVHEKCCPYWQGIFYFQPQRLLISGFLFDLNLNTLKILLAKFITVELIIINFIAAECIVFNLVKAELANFEFPLYGIVLIGFYGLKGIIFSLIAFLGIHISFKPSGRAIIYKVLFYVLPGDVFGVDLGFLTGVL